MRDDRSRDGDTPAEPAVRRSSSSSLSFAATTRTLVMRLEERGTVAAKALIPQGAALVATFDDWAWNGQPDVVVRNGVYADALRWHESARCVLSDSGGR